MKVSARKTLFSEKRTKKRQGKRKKEKNTHLRAQRVGKLVLFERKHVVSEAVAQPVARLFQPLPKLRLVVDENTGSLVLHRGHHFELRAAPPAPVAQHAQRLIVSRAAAVGFFADELAEKHERAEFLLDATQHAPALAGDVRDAVRGDAHDRQVVSLRRVADFDRAQALAKHPAHVIHRARARGVGARNGQHVPPARLLVVVQVEPRAGGARDFALRRTARAEQKRGVLVAYGHRVGVSRSRARLVVGRRSSLRETKRRFFFFARSATRRRVEKRVGGVAPRHMPFSSPFSLGLAFRRRWRSRERLAARRATSIARARETGRRLDRARRSGAHRATAPVAGIDAYLLRFSLPTAAPAARLGFLQIPTASRSSILILRPLVVRHARRVLVHRVPHRVFSSASATLALGRAPRTTRTTGRTMSLGDGEKRC